MQILLQNKLSQKYKNTCEIDRIIEKISFQENNFDFDDELKIQDVSHISVNSKILQFKKKYGQQQMIFASKNYFLKQNKRQVNCQLHHMNIKHKFNERNHNQSNKKTLKPIIFDELSSQPFEFIDPNILKQAINIQKNPQKCLKNIQQTMQKKQMDSQTTRPSLRTEIDFEEKEISSLIIPQPIFGSVYQKKQNFIRIKKSHIQKDFILQQKIGQGAYGIVYKGQNISTKQIRAIKMIKNKSKLGSRAINEQNILKKLDHPNIIKLFQVYQSSNQTYLVTEMCNGNSLSSYLKKKFPFTKQMKKQIIFQIFKGVCYLHEHKIIHRDLKPQNIMFSEEITQTSLIENIQVKIIDFGLALQSDQKINNDWSRIGTKNYISPEGFQGIYSNKNDVWACGIIMHIMELNQNPFTHIDTQQQQLNKNAYKLNRQKLRWRRLSNQTKQLITQLLQINYVLRIDMKTAFSSSYFNNLQIPIIKNQIKQKLLKKQKQNNIFIDTVESFLSFNKISMEKRIQYSKIFYSINKSHNGQLSLQQLSSFLQINNPQNQIQIFKIINKSGKGMISFQEFIVTLSNKRQLFSRQNIEYLFNIIDINKNNRIDKQQLRYFIKNISVKDLEKLYYDIEKSQKPINCDILEQYILSNIIF